MGRHRVIRGILVVMSIVFGWQLGSYVASRKALPASAQVKPVIVRESYVIERYVGYAAVKKALGSDCTAKRCVIKENLGGVASTFQNAALHILETKNFEVVVDGDVYSAFTIFADLARPKVCVTPNASFNF